MAEEIAMRIALAVLIVIAAAVPALAQGGKSHEIREPKGTWQQPKEFQKPRDTWQQPGEIQVPKGIKAVRVAPATGCERRLSVVADALFDFDKANLRADAEETLVAAGPEIAKLGGKPARIEGHTDALGTVAYPVYRSLLDHEGAAWLILTSGTSG
jgi:outer membrane protein OmpA-like peptidoglycan-associated protein